MKNKSSVCVANLIINKKKTICMFKMYLSLWGANMKSQELNLIPEKISQKQITKKEAIDIIGTFICQNYPIFGLHKYDEDFRADVLLYFLERGERVIESYNNQIADFFTYLYSNISSYIQTRKKMVAKNCIKESITISETANFLYEKESAYNNIDYKKLELAKVPYSYKPITAENLKKIFEPISSVNNDKKILVLAMKSSFYISDSMIRKVCNLYKIKEEDFYSVIQYCKESITSKSNKHNIAIERRNYAYFHHKKYEHELEKSKEKYTNSEADNNLIRKNNKHENNWKSLNYKFEHGFLYLRPTNRTIAEILGICERQVSYYINCAKKDFVKNNSQKGDNAE